MDRRKFIKNTSWLTLPLILQSCDWLSDTPQYQVAIQSDASTGHLIRKSQQFDNGDSYAVKTLIVGGGIAGLSAACSLNHKDFILCELSEQLGGSSSSNSFEGIPFSQGAHYDLAYPQGYGEEVLALLKRLDVISHQPWSDTWGFKDREHIIFGRSKNQCFDHGTFRKDVLPESTLKGEFLKLIFSYKEQMHLPTRLISEEHRSLNTMTFIDYLDERLPLTPEFIKGLDYHMKDDYGAGSASVSALAGIHYFICRPYFDQEVELFSPPEGNNYFINKMARSLPNEKLKTQQLVKKIKETENGFEVAIVDIAHHKVDTIQCEQVVYAGQKHALKFIYPQESELFASNSYSPWMVVNIILKDDLPMPAFWQNEMLTTDETFMGFVDSATQQRKSKSYRTLTCYYCLPPSSRKDLLNAPTNKNIIAQKTIEQLNSYFKQDVSKDIMHVNIKVMGHAMPIPTPNYLFSDKNALRKNKNIVFAGVDNGRLPLLYEALDSGIEAVRWLDV